MTENQVYTSFRNEHAISTNQCDCASQDIFDLEKYGPYLDKIRTFFVPSLEYRIHSLLAEFVYSTNSRWAKQFPCFKKFIDTIVTWKDPLNRVVEYDIGTMEEMIKNSMKRIIKDSLNTCFLDSVILHHRLTKVCRELDALGIEDNILRNLNVWNFVNERDYLLDCNCCTDFTPTMDCNMNLNTVPCNAKGSIKYKKALKPLSKNIYNKNIKYTLPISDYQEHRQRIPGPNKNYPQQREDNSKHFSTWIATGSQNNNINKTNRSFNKKPCNTKLKKIRNSLKLKIIVHKVYLENYKCSTFSSFNVTRLSLPCKPKNLIRRIFEADPSLTESCLIVMKQKFENNMYNVCSCLNSVLEQLNVKLRKALCLNCEIYPGYISFKLRASNIKTCLFVARVPICQNVRKCTIQQDYPILSSKANSKPNIKINESKCFEQYKDDGMNFKDKLECINEETEKFDARCSQFDQTFIKDTAVDVSQIEAENNSEKKITCMTTEDIQNLAISSCNNSCKDIIEEIFNMMPCTDNSEERSKEYREVLSSTEIKCDDDAEKCKKGILESNNSVIKTDTSTQLINSVNCMCSSNENFIEPNDEIESAFSNKDLASLSQATDTNERDWICSSSKKSNLENEVCSINTCSITSFALNSEHDKQLVELNCNQFTNNNINAIDEGFDIRENDSSLNSAKVKIGYNSCCSSRCNDFIDVTIIDDISKENIVCTFETSQSNFDAVKVQSIDHNKTMRISPRNNKLLTISIQMPKSTILSKGVSTANVDTCYSRTVWLSSEDDKNISAVVETSDRSNEIANLFTRALIVSTKEDKILPDANRELFNVKEDFQRGTQDFITSSKSFSTSNGRFQSSKGSRNSGISTGEYLCAGNHSTCATSNASLYYHSFATTSECTMNDKRDEFQKSNKSKKLSKVRGRGYVRSRNGIRTSTSTTIKHRTTSRNYPNDYSAKTRPQTMLAMTKLRNSIDNSVDRIKRLIRTKLGRILFNNKTFRRNEELSEESTKRKKTSKGQGYSITSCSTCDCCRQGYSTSSRESSNIILSIRRTKERRRRNEGNIKFRDCRLTDSSKALSNFRSIKTSPSYNLLTSTEDIKKQKLSRNNQYNGKKKIRNIINSNKNSHRCDLKYLGTNTTISSQSTKVSLIENDSKSFGHRSCKRQEEIYDNERICKQDLRENEQIRHKYAQCVNKNNNRDISVRYTNVDSNESLKASLSHTWRGNNKNVYQQFYDISEVKNVKRLASSRKNRQIFEDVSEHSDDSQRSNDNLGKRHIFAILTDACNDYMDELDLDFKLKLLRYVELCKSIKRSLMRTLQPNDIYEISTASIADINL